MMILQIKKGFTLVEVLIATFILSVGIMSTLLFFSIAMVTGDYSRDITVATSHGEYILEEMKTQNTVEDIQATNWENWLTDKGFNLLPQERVNVSFSNAFKNSIDVKIIVSWIKRSRTNNIVLYTKILK